MVEGGRFPGRRAVALRARMRELSFNMIVGFVVVRLVARPAIGGEIAVVAVGMTRGTVGRDVRSGQREAGVVVIERRWFPTDVRVALCAIVGELIINVTWIGCLLVIRLMARPAVRGSPVVLAVRVALGARGIDMSAHQREV